MPPLLAEVTQLVVNGAMAGAILAVPDEWIFIGYLCLGYPQHDDDRPELERAQWERRRPTECFLLKR